MACFGAIKSSGSPSAEALRAALASCRQRNVLPLPAGPSRNVARILAFYGNAPRHKQKTLSIGEMSEMFRKIKSGADVSAPSVQDGGACFCAPQVRG